MAKGFRSFTQNVVPAASGTTALQGEFATLTVSGQTKELVMTTTQWPVDGTRLTYIGWNGNAHWDTSTKKIHMLMKSNQTGGDGEGAYAAFDTATNNWTQPWRGYIKSGTNDGDNIGHVYNSYDWSVADQDWYGVAYNMYLSSWGGSISSGAWSNDGSLTSPAPFVSTSTGGQAPWSMAVVPAAYTGSVEGLFLLTRNRLILTKKDLSGAVQLWQKNSNQSFYYQAILSDGGYYVMHGGNGYTKTNSAYNNTDARATSEVPVYVVIPNGAGGATVNRIQDAPSAAIGSGSSNSDKMCLYNGVIYLFEGNGTGVWTFDMLGAAQTWGKLSHTHIFGDGATKSFILCPIPEYGGIVAIGNSGTGTAKVTNQPINMYLYKV